MVLVPKGGIKLAGIPLTWGYLTLGTSVGLILVFGLLTGRFRLKSSMLLGYLITLPFAGYVFASIAINGRESTGLTVALIVAVALLPGMFLLVIAPWMERPQNRSLILLLVKRCIFLAAVYGMFLFGYFTITKQVIEIPYITVNASEDDAMLKKDNRRGEFQKLVSTYNNGNIYAICILMLLPLYCALEKSTLRQWFVKGSIVLTLSRTAWIGLFICEILMLVFQQRKNAKTVILTAASLAIALLLVAFFLFTMGRDLTWLADSSLGGRQSQLSALEEFRMFSNPEPFAGLAEMLPMAILGNFGAVGFLLFLLSMATPLIGFLVRKTRDQVTVAAVLGCTTYYFISLSDGAFLLIPVMAFFWFLAALVWSQPGANPSAE